MSADFTVKCPSFALIESAMCTENLFQPVRCAKTEPKTTIERFVQEKKVTPLSLLFFIAPRPNLLSGPNATNVVFFHFCLQRNYFLLNEPQWQ